MNYRESDTERYCRDARRLRAAGLSRGAASIVASEAGAWVWALPAPTPPTETPEPPTPAPSAR